MREGTADKTGLEYINEAIEKLSQKHAEHMEFYGKNNDKRLTGKNETALYTEVTHGVANRGCSIRIGNNTSKNKKGYFEDRRPGANCDPYMVTGMLFKATVL